MSSPALFGRRLLRASQNQAQKAVVSRRGLAAAASGSFQYETGESSGVKYASRDLPGPTTTLTVVAKAGTRFQPLPGYSDALEKFAFKVKWYFRSTTVSMLTRQFAVVNNQKIHPSNHTRVGIVRRRAVCVSLSRTRCCAVQIPSRRFTLFHRIARRDNNEDEIYE